MKFKSALLAAALAACSLHVDAAGFGHSQTMHIDGQALRVAETSARVLGNAEGNAPLLLDDITDGLGKTKIPGYKLMVMSRTSSLAAEARPARDGQGWRDNRMIHRGTKLLLGIPVRNGQPDLKDARLLGMAAISDAGAPDFKAEDKLRPRGKQLVSRDASISQPQLRLSALSLPDMQSGEQSGGGVKLEASAMVGSQRVATQVDSTFTMFDVARPDARGFAADKRFVGQ